MTSSTRILAAVALALTCRSAPPGDQYTFSLDDWAAMLRVDPACVDLPPSPDSTWGHVAVLDLSVTLRLPSGFVEHERRDTTYRSWVTAESSKVELWITDVPAAGFAASGQIGIDSLVQCSITSDPPGWLLTRFRVTPSHAAAIRYLGMAHTISAPGRAVNVFVESRTSSERDQLIGAMLALQLAGDR